MKEIVDRLSRDLATGVSRRKALWMFLAGAGALGLSAKNKAMAQSSKQQQLCHDWCSQQAEQFMEMCVTASGNCPANYCPDFTTLQVNSSLILVNSRPLPFHGNVILVEESCAPLV